MGEEKKIKEEEDKQELRFMSENIQSLEKEVCF